MPSKQVLVMKKFPKERNMRIGKYVAQGAHASLGAVLGMGQISDDEEHFVIPLNNDFVRAWIMGNFKKVTCYVTTDQELLDIYDTAKSAGIACSLIRDAGLTEFNGIPTLTAVGIGPDNDDLINKITGNLPLF